MWTWPDQPRALTEKALMMKKLSKRTTEEGRLLVLAAVLERCDAEIVRVGMMLGASRSASASQWSEELSLIAHLHRLSTEGRAQLVEMALHRPEPSRSRRSL